MFPFISQKEGEKLEDISPTLLNECAQLVKANSIEGSKLSTCHVIYVSICFLKIGAQVKRIGIFGPF